MRNVLLSAVAVGSLLLAASPVLAKGTWVPANPVQNSLSTTLFGINDTDIVTGAYEDSSGNTHGFIGPFDGSDYTSFDDPGGATEPRAINDSNITDGYDTGTLDTWYRTAKGKLTAVTKMGVALTNPAQEINSAGIFAADYVNAKGLYRGYLGANSKYKTTIKGLKIKNSGFAGRAIDTAGDVAGWYYDSSMIQHGYLIPKGGKVTGIDYPNAVYTVVEGMNDNGFVTGQWEDSSGILHGFYYVVSSGKFTSLDAPGATSDTQVWGINDSNVIAVSSDAGSFVYCMTSKGCPSAAAGVANTLHVSAKHTPAAP
jgi:hypothetical protein